MITILSIGKNHEAWVQTGIERYQKRLKAPFTISWELLPHSSLSGEKARSEESERIVRRLPQGAYVILLDETGRKIDSPGVAEIIETAATQAKRIYIIIGGAYGVTKELREQSAIVLSLSDLVFPHQLVRLILTEQLYRAQEISRGGNYHHQ